MAQFAGASISVFPAQVNQCWKMLCLRHDIYSFVTALKQGLAHVIRLRTKSS